MEQMKTLELAIRASDAIGAMHNGRYSASYALWVLFLFRKGWLLFFA